MSTEPVKPGAEVYETAWLIEMIGVPGIGNYWGEPLGKRVGFGIVDKAIRFGRREDAEAMMRNDEHLRESIQHGLKLRATEHVWYAPARDSSAPAQQGGQPKAQPSSAEVVAWRSRLKGQTLDKHWMLSTQPRSGAGIECEPLYAEPIAAVPIPELQAMCERCSNSTPKQYWGSKMDVINELRALIDKHGKE